MSYSRSLNEKIISNQSFNNINSKAKSDNAATSDIIIFKNNKNIENCNVDSCVITQKNKEESVQIKNKIEDNSVNENSAEWIREAMPTSLNPASLSSKVNSSSKNALCNAVYQNNNFSNSDNLDENYNDISNGFDVMYFEDDVSNVDTLANANDDEGDGNLLQTFFEKDINNGYNTNNFVGAKYEKNIYENTSDQNIMIYSDNSYRKNKTSIIFGGTANILVKYNENYTNDSDYNVYAYLKQNSKTFTYGLGGIANKNDGVNNINISIGAIHNDSGIYGIIQKNISKISGLPVYTSTKANIGIGKSSGLLNFDDFNPKNDAFENLEKSDSTAEFIEEQKSKNYEIDEDNISSNSNTCVNLILSNTDNNKEYGIKAGKIFRYLKHNNNSYILPYSAVSNINVDSKEGVKFVLGANVGKNITFGNNLQMKVKGIVETSRTILSENSPNDYIIANANVILTNKKLSSQAAIGAFFNDAKKYCKYIKATINYEFNKHLKANFNFGIAEYKFNNENNKILESSVGVRYTL